jgi:hypothetical protein
MTEKDGIFTVHCAYGDGGERSRGPLIAVCSTGTNALAQSKGKGWYGGDGEVYERKALRFQGKIYLLDENTSGPVDLDGEQAKVKDRIRKEALAKLNPVEIEALGLKPQ